MTYKKATKSSYVIQQLVIASNVVIRNIVY